MSFSHSPETPSPLKKKRVAFYIRVSKEEQADGFSLNAQQDILRKHVELGATLHGYDPNSVRIFQDIGTGANLNRPNFQEMMKAAKNKELDVVMVFRIDRLSRNLKHLLETFTTLQKYGVDFISAQENMNFSGHIGQLVFNMFGAIAQFERELIRDRSAMGKKRSAKEGNFVGTGAPYGYTTVPNKGKGSKLKINPAEAEIVKEVYGMFLFDKFTPRQIAKKLKDRDVPRGMLTKKRSRSKEWTEKVIKTMLTSPLYRGEYSPTFASQSNGEREVITTEVPAIIDELQFLRVQNLIKTRKNLIPTGHQYLLQGKIFDMTTPYPLAFSGAKGSKGYHYYQRAHKTIEGEKYPQFSTSVEGLNTFVWDKIVEAFENPIKFIDLYVVKTKSGETFTKNLTEKLQQARKKLSDLEVRRQKIHDRDEKGYYEEREYLDLLSDNETKMGDVKSLLKALEQEAELMANIEERKADIAEVTKRYKHNLDTIDEAGKQILVDLLIDRIEMYRDYYIDPESQKEKPRIQAKVFLQFNPKLWMMHQDELLTKDPLSDNKKSPKGAKSNGSGGTRQI